MTQPRSGTRQISISQTDLPLRLSRKYNGIEIITVQKTIGTNCRKKSPDIRTSPNSYYKMAKSELECNRGASLVSRSALYLFSPTSHPHTTVATVAPANCAAMKPGASAGRMPAKVSESARAMVMAGLAKEVEDVNQ